MSLTARFPFDDPPPPPPETAPVPTSAEWDSHDLELTITFDKPLVDQPLSRSNWTVELTGGGTQEPDSAVVVVPDQVLLMFGVDMSDGRNVSYFATPPDVVGQNTLNVEPFTWEF